MLQRTDIRILVEQYGHENVRNELRLASNAIRTQIQKRTSTPSEPLDPESVAQTIALDVARTMREHSQSTHRPVFNLTGTVLHTNLGRAVLPEKAIEALRQAAASPTSLEYDLDSGKRGDRDSHVEALLKKLSGAEAATVVNNNAAAVLLTLNSIAPSSQVLVSRGELVEIGGAFRMPEIMAAAGCQLVEVGTTNRTHLRDFEDAITDQTAAFMTVHPSNYQIQGFTAAVPHQDLAGLAQQHGLPLIDDIGSGSFVDMRTFGLPYERTVADAIGAGADLVTFSGDKLLGGPQCGMIVGRSELIQKIKKNPMKRAMRVDKLTLCALEAVLRLFTAPEQLRDHHPVIRQLTRKPADIAAAAERLLPAFQDVLGQYASFEIAECMSQIGSGALPIDLLPSYSVAISPLPASSSRGLALNRWARAMRNLPRPIIGRITDDRILLDLRTLEDEAALLGQLSALADTLART